MLNRGGSFDKRAGNVFPSLISNTEIVKKRVIWSTLREYTSDNDSVFDCYRNVAGGIVFDAPAEKHGVCLVDALPGVPIPRFPSGKLLSRARVKGTIAARSSLMAGLMSGADANSMQ
jgi:hypothetical protein